MDAWDVDDFVHKEKCGALMGPFVRITLRNREMPERTLTVLYSIRNKGATMKMQGCLDSKTGETIPGFLLEDMGVNVGMLDAMVNMVTS